MIIIVDKGDETKPPTVEFCKATMTALKLPTLANVLHRKLSNLFENDYEPAQFVRISTADISESRRWLTTNTGNPAQASWIAGSTKAWHWPTSAPVIQVSGFKELAYVVNLLDDGYAIDQVTERLNDYRKAKAAQQPLSKPTTGPNTPNQPKEKPMIAKAHIVRLGTKDAPKEVLVHTIPESCYLNRQTAQTAIIVEANTQNNEFVNPDTHRIDVIEVTPSFSIGK